MLYTYDHHQYRYYYDGSDDDDDDDDDDEIAHLFVQLGITVAKENTLSHAAQPTKTASSVVKGLYGD